MVLFFFADRIHILIRYVLPEDMTYPRIGNLVVDTEHRRKGVALSLMKQAIKNLQSGGSLGFYVLWRRTTSPLHIFTLLFEVFSLEEKDDSKFLNPPEKDRNLSFKRIGRSMKFEFSHSMIYFIRI